MNAHACDDPVLAEALREHALGRNNAAAGDHLARCQRCRVEVERLRRLMTIHELECARPEQVDAAWRRFEGRGELAGQRVQAGAWRGWALAAAAVAVAALLVCAQLRRPTREQFTVAGVPSAIVSAAGEMPGVGPLGTSIVMPRAHVEDTTEPVEPNSTGKAVPPTLGPWVDPDDGEMKARRMLEPRVWSGRATVDEIRMLKAICRHQKDAACVARASDLLAEALRK